MFKNLKPQRKKQEHPITRLLEEMVDQWVKDNYHRKYATSSNREGEWDLDLDSEDENERALAEVLYYTREENK